MYIRTKLDNSEPSIFQEYYGTLFDLSSTNTPQTCIPNYNTYANKAGIEARYQTTILH